MNYLISSWITSGIFMLSIEELAVSIFSYNFEFFLFRAVTTTAKVPKMLAMMREPRMVITLAMAI